MADASGALVEFYAERLRMAQDIRFGPLARRHEGARPIAPDVVGAVLHALADHTHASHIVNTIVDGTALAPNQRATSLARYFHALGDVFDEVAIEGPPQLDVPVNVTDARARLRRRIAEQALASEMIRDVGAVLDAVDEALFSLNNPRDHSIASRAGNARRALEGGAPDQLGGNE